MTTSLRRAPRPSEIAAHLDMSVEEVVDVLGAQQAYRPDSLDAVIGPHSEGSAVGDLLGVADSALNTVEYRHELRDALARLPERERTVLILRFFGDLTQTQIAEQVGVSQMHVSRLLAKSLATLRSRIDSS